MVIYKPWGEISPQGTFQKSSHQSLISAESVVGLLSVQYKFFWRYLPGMHASFPWKRRPNGRTCNKTGGIEDQGREQQVPWL